MQKPAFLQGKILIKDTLSHSSAVKGTDPFVTILPFDVSHYDHSSLENTLMVNFKRFHFSKEEKKKLTSSIRQNIHVFEHFNLRELTEKAEELCDRIVKMKNTHHVLESSGYGSFVCLAALFSGQIPCRKNLTLHLHDSPLALFPRTLAPPKDLHLPHYKLYFHLDQSCWFKSIATLSQCPDFLELDYQIIHNYPLEDKVVQRDRKLY